MQSYIDVKYVNIISPYLQQFKKKGDLILHLGEMSDCINASEYLSNMVGEKNTPAPKFNLDAEVKLH